jgi:hypothetical protein
MEYKRLTERTGDNRHNTDAPIEVVVEQLGCLEDLIEKGELLLVPKAYWRVDKSATVQQGCINWELVYYCSKCNRKESKAESYCPRCGAYMEVKDMLEHL